MKNVGTVLSNLELLIGIMFDRDWSANNIFVHSLMIRLKGKHKQKFLLMDFREGIFRNS